MMARYAKTFGELRISLSIADGLYRNLVASDKENHIVYGYSKSFCYTAIEVIIELQDEIEKAKT